MLPIDFFRHRIDTMINLNDPLAVLASRLPWAQMEAAVASKFEHQNRTGEVLVGQELVQRWSENILWQYFSGMDYYEHRLPCDATQIGRLRRALGEDGMELMLKATIDTAVAIGAVQARDLERVSAAKRAGISLKQTYAKECKTLRWKAGGYAHAKQFRRLQRVLKRQRTILGVVIREVQRKMQAPDFAPNPLKKARPDSLTSLVSKVRWRCRRTHSAQRPRAGRHPDTRRCHPDQTRGGRLGLSRGGWRQPGPGDHSPGQVQATEQATKELAQAAQCRRTGHRAPEVRSPHGSLLASGHAG